MYTSTYYNRIHYSAGIQTQMITPTVLHYKSSKNSITYAFHICAFVQGHKYLVQQVLQVVALDTVHHKALQGGHYLET